MNLRVPQTAGKFLSRCTISGFSRRARFHDWVSEWVSSVDIGSSRHDGYETGYLSSIICYRAHIWLGPSDPPPVPPLATSNGPKRAEIPLSFTTWWRR
jgi:hypothetical protein